MNRPALVIAMRVLAVAAVIYVIQDGIHYLNEPEVVVITQFGAPVRAPIAS